jgi:succinate dehydrogenase flavin-adding protein (antitoxin of CptAB toxin-antitoxin module)
MKERHISRPEMTWLEMDVLDLKFGEEEFDLVVDKGESRLSPIVKAEDQELWSKCARKGEPWPDVLC